MLGLLQVLLLTQKFVLTENLEHEILAYFVNPNLNQHPPLFS